MTVPYGVMTMCASLSSMRPTHTPFIHCVSSFLFRPGGSIGTRIMMTSPNATNADLYGTPFLAS